MEGNNSPKIKIVIAITKLGGYKQCKMNLRVKIFVNHASLIDLAAQM